ncbi:MAG: hypothetical protein AAGM22_21160 [Acidobacteriota bacterium]
MTDFPTPSRDRGRHAFHTTRWSLVAAAGDRGDLSSESVRRALSDLCADYWYPLYAYVRRRGYGHEDAGDLTQAFFAKLLAKHDLAAADPTRGRFRSFLLSSLKNFLAGAWRHRNAEKRGGAFELTALDFDAAEEAYRLEPREGLDPESLYHRRWALGMLARTAERLEDHYESTGRSELFHALKDGVLGGGTDAPPYPELAPRLGMSEGALRTAASRMRTRWRLELRKLVAETVHPTSTDPDGEVESELHALIDAVGR